MDNVISRMMRLLGVIVVLGYVCSGLLCVQVKNFGGCGAFMFWGVISAAVFTVIWAVGTIWTQHEIGKGRKRSDITTQRVIGVSTGVLALFTCIGFVVAGVSGVNADDNTASLWLELLGSVSTAILCAFWCGADIFFLQDQDQNQSQNQNQSN